MEHQKIKEKQLGRVMLTKFYGTQTEEKTVFIPTTRFFANAKVLEVNDNGFTVHRLSNYNTEGDFSTELMYFDKRCIFDETDEEQRNEIRKAHGLIPIV